jgi:hypothetical protein
MQNIYKKNADIGKLEDIKESNQKLNSLIFENETFLKKKK